MYLPSCLRLLCAITALVVTTGASSNHTDTSKESRWLKLRNLLQGNRLNETDLNEPQSSRVRPKLNWFRLESDTWNAHFAQNLHASGAVTPGDEPHRVDWRRTELRGERPSHESSWRTVKARLMENSTGIPGPFHKTFVFGKCATGLTKEKLVFDAFVIEKTTSFPTDCISPVRIWKFIAFSSIGCSQHETEDVSFYKFRECTHEEQSLLIRYHRRGTWGNSTELFETITSHTLAETADHQQSPPCCGSPCTPGYMFP